MTTTRMAPHFNTCFVKCLPRPATIEPNPSISGMVPSAKKNIDSATKVRLMKVKDMVLKDAHEFED